MKSRRRVFSVALNLFLPVSKFPSSFDTEPCQHTMLGPSIPCQYRALCRTLCSGSLVLRLLQCNLTRLGCSMAENRHIYLYDMIFIEPSGSLLLTSTKAHIHNVLSSPLDTFELDNFQMFRQSSLCFCFPKRLQFQSSSSNFALQSFRY